MQLSQRAAGRPAERIRQRRLTYHGRIIERPLPLPVDDGERTPSAGSDPFRRPRRRRQRASRVTERQVVTLRQALARAEQERDQVIVDGRALRLRHAQLTVRLFALETARQVPSGGTSNADPAVRADLERLAAIERQNQALAREMASVRVAVEHMTRAMTPAPAPPVVPWYRRFWLFLIGREVRAAAWTAADRRS